jgi:transposase-like protein
MSKYSKKIAKRIVELVKSDTYTINEICNSVKITPFTYYYWINNNEEFAQAIQSAKDERMQVFVLEARKSLMKKIQGYEVDEKKVVSVDSGRKDEMGKPIPKIKEQTTIKKHIQPDTAAIIFTLTNGAPEEFKNRQSNELTGKNGRDLFASMSDEALSNKIAELERKLKQ